MGITNWEKLTDTIRQRGSSVAAISRALGISRQAFYKKRDSETGFSQADIIEITKELQLTPWERDKIFFDPE